MRTGGLLTVLTRGSWDLWRRWGAWDPRGWCIICRRLLNHSTVIRYFWGTPSVDKESVQLGYTFTFGIYQGDC